MDKFLSCSPHSAGQFVALKKVDSQLSELLFSLLIIWTYGKNRSKNKPKAYTESPVIPNDRYLCQDMNCSNYIWNNGDIMYHIISFFEFKKGKTYPNNPIYSPRSGLRVTAHSLKKVCFL